MKFRTNVLYGETLTDFVLPVQHLQKRECFQQLEEYIYNDRTERVLILYGLRRTGKTTMLRQLIAEMGVAIRSKTAFIQISGGNNLAELKNDLDLLYSRGYRYLIIDEVTLLEDFIEGAALFSDIYVARGMRIILSGTDSLGFSLSAAQELYDRCYLLHTTHVPYREFERVVGVPDIDAYIHYGGTMCSDASPYHSAASADAYVNSAVARNIQHSLQHYQQGSHFRHLLELYEADELTSAINRVVADINHRFAVSVLTRDFKSGDLANTANKPEMTVTITDTHVYEIKEYLQLLDLTVDVDVVYLPNLSDSTTRTILTHPGLRYAQAQALVLALMRDEAYQSLPLDERNRVSQRILSDVVGRILEEIVLLETKKALPSCEVFTLCFARGEFDMVVFDPVAGSCSIYEVKHSKEAAPQQYAHLIDSEKCIATEHRYGKITGRFVLYRGSTCTVNGIQYINVEEYLRRL